MTKSTTQHATAAQSSITVHIRVPAPVYDGIAKRAAQERRRWSQMCVIMLEDALTDSGIPLPPRPAQLRQLRVIGRQSR